MSALWHICFTGWAHSPMAWDPFRRECLPLERTILVPWQEVLNEDTDQNPLYSFIDKLQGDFLLYGWSLGALAALRFAALHPARTIGLLLAGGMARFTANEGRPGVDPRSLAMMRRQLVRKPEPVLADFFDQGIAPGEAPRQTRAEFVEFAMDAGVEKLDEGLAFLANTDRAQDLPNVQCPVAIVHGAEDRIVPAAAGRWLAERMPQSVYTEVPGAGHNLLECAVAELVTARKAVAP